MFRRLIILALTSITVCSQANEIPAMPIHGVYAASQDRFRMTCSFVIQGSTLLRSATLSPQTPEANFSIDRYLLKITPIYPSKVEVATQLKPIPFLFYNYEVSVNSGNLVHRTHQKSNLLSLSIEIPGESSPSKCLLFPLPSDPIPMSDDGYQLAHINVHPHDSYDPGHLLTGKIEPLLIDNRIRSFILLEGKKFPYAMSESLPGILTNDFPFWDPEKNISLKELSDATPVVAPQGEYRWSKKVGGVFPKRILITGGFFKACIDRQVAFLNNAFSVSREKNLEIIFVDDWILNQPSEILGQPGTLGTIPPDPTALKQEGEREFLRTLTAFNRSYQLDESMLDYHFVYSDIKKNADGACPLDAVFDVSTTHKLMDDAVEKKRIVFHMVRCR